MATGVYRFDYWLVLQCGVGSKGGVGPTEDWWAGGLAQVHFLLARHFDAGHPARSDYYLSKMYGQWQRNRIWMVPCKRTSIAVPISDVGVLPNRLYLAHVGWCPFFVAVVGPPSIYETTTAIFFPLHLSVFLTLVSRSLQTSSFSFSAEAIIKKKK